MPKMHLYFPPAETMLLIGFILLFPELAGQLELTQVQSRMLERMSQAPSHLESFLIPWGGADFLQVLQGELLAMPSCKNRLLPPDASLTRRHSSHGPGIPLP